MNCNNPLVVLIVIKYLGDWYSILQLLYMDKTAYARVMLYVEDGNNPAQRYGKW